MLNRFTIGLLVLSAAACGDPWAAWEKDGGSPAPTCGGKLAPACPAACEAGCYYYPPPMLSSAWEVRPDRPQDHAPGRVPARCWSAALL